MRLAFIIDRNVSYRSLGSVIDAALARGWQAECWHDYRQARTGPKAYLFPSLEGVPAFASGRPAAHAFQTADELWSWVVGRRADAIVSLNAPAWYVPHAVLPDTAARWIGVQQLGDFFQNNGPEEILTCHAVAVYTDWWVRWAAGYLHDLGRLPDAAGFERRLAGKSAAVGFPQLDQRRLVDPSMVRRRWGIPEGRPVVVYCPFPGAMSDGSFWARHVYLEPSPAKRVLRMLLHRRFEYARHLIHGWHDRNVVRAVRAFCDRNGGALIIKSRLKTPIPRYAEALADRCVYDDSYYPATIMEALSIADLCINFYSSVVLEAVALGVPSLCVTFSAEDYYGWHPELCKRFKRYFAPKHSQMFECPGVTTSMTIPELLSSLPSKRLDEFSFREPARQAYLAAHVGPQDGQSSTRVLDLVQRVAQGKAAPALACAAS